MTLCFSRHISRCFIIVILAIGMSLIRARLSEPERLRGGIARGYGICALIIFVGSGDMCSSRRSGFRNSKN